MLKIDPELLRKAKQLGGFRTRTETINAALAEYIKHREQLKIFTLAGAIDYDPKYNYKQQRRVK